MYDSHSCVVVKVGSSSLVTAEMRLDEERIDDVVRQICRLVDFGQHVILVTSGAVATGAGVLGVPRQGLTLPEKQACAAVGQGMLMQIYHRAFASHGVAVGQVLLTRDVFGNRSRYIHARNTVTSLLHFGVVPIVNENDTVAVDEIRFGDNDALSAQVASLVGARQLFLLTDTDGLYTSDPRRDPSARRIGQLLGVSEEILAVAGASGTQVGTGGMRSKLIAAKMAAESGVSTVIARAADPDVLLRAFNGDDVGTRIHPVTEHLSSRKRWIAYASAVRGQVVIDSGAVRAISLAGKSLLASGVTGVDGTFQAGDIVSIVASNGREVARGVINYDSAEIERIKGLRTTEIMRLRGGSGAPEVVHRDNMVAFSEVRRGEEQSGDRSS